MSIVLRALDAHKSYGETKALDGAGVTLHKGEWLAVLGPNGAGKTTLIRAVAGRVKLDRGEITLLGHTLSRDNPSADARIRARLGIVPQELALYPLLTAAENLRVFGALNGVDGSQLTDRIKWALEWTGLADRAHTLSKTFSGGMKRRLNIACGVLHQPDVILLDEPTVGVDPQSRERIWSMLGQLRAAGASLLLTTHQLDEAQQICDRIVIIDHGKTIADGTMDELIGQTIGRARRITLLLDKVPPALTPGSPAHAGSSTLAASHAQPDDRAVTYTVEDVATELPPLLARVNSSGAKVIDVQVQAPSLQAVFIHLTGRELRE